MTVRVPAESTHGTPDHADGTPGSGRPPSGSHVPVIPPAQVELPAGRPLPAVHVIALGSLVIIAALYGLVVDDAYRLVSELTRQTWRSQDAVNLATVPVLLWTSRRARNGSFSAHLVSVGILTWLTYCYAHLAVGAPLNPMFLTYLAVLTLAGFGMLDGLLRVNVSAVSMACARCPRRATAWFLTIAGVGIAALWLSEILLALPDGLPPNIHLSQLPNPSWVLDLSWIIPCALAAGMMLRRRHPAGPVIAAAVVVMLLILSVTMLTVVPFALAAGLGADPVVTQQLLAFAILFTVLGGITAWLLVRAQRRLGVVTAAWLRRGWWPEEADLPRS